MRSHQDTSPLPPDPGGQEDIMSERPRADQAARREEEAPLPPAAAGPEDVLSEDPPDGTASSR